MDHGWYIEFTHLLVERIPVFVRQRRRGPSAPGRIRVQVTTDKTQLVYAAFELRNRIGRRNAGRLRQLADAHEVFGIETANPEDQVVAMLGPVPASRLVADV